ncbi:maleylpyruvate isomerase N-terminal domain-containing protein [Streptacidiphilus fuscans]|uniref:Maleylpyruvate isomerase N-terminal domain-containing protein n=1 Tax=Streptacidiphilus fuscans TaxID=2789292 RepID=A0A931B4Z7_9ACTN|nr:maleylpyruvate isomerase N-terminal domain-containing protein [Streptacidiphilus fuscans]MBF9067005.1 maleylpyruvate isomerase N-terminal domain-containing protein [Streptacidiphilus fuscans]
MGHQNTSRADLLVELWHSWAERGAALEPGEWDRATRLPGWSVRALYAHVAPDPAMLAVLREAVVAGPATVTSGSEILRIFNRPGGVAHAVADQVATQAQETAGSMTPEALVSRFAETGPAVVAELAALPPDTAVAHPAGTVTLGALREIAVMEATVHLLDLIDAVGGPPPPAAALRATRDMLADVVDPTAFIEAAAGRTKEAVLPVMR